MSEHPIIMSGESVRDILDGRKTETRRVVKAQPAAGVRYVPGGGALEDGHGRPMPCPYGKPGDRLWVRETFCVVDDRDHGGERWVDYRATPRYEDSHPAGWHEAPDDAEALKWKPSIHMPRWVCRLVLEVEELRVERLKEIDRAGLDAEGVRVPVSPHGNPLLELTGKYAACRYLDDPETRDGEAWLRAYFASLWDELNAKRGFPWKDNPWVWVVRFRRVEE